MQQLFRSIGAPARLAPLALLLLANTATAYSEADRDGLWAVVRDCVWLKRTLGLTIVCDGVELPTEGDFGSVVIKSPRSRTEYLVAPAEAIAGMEVPEAYSAATTLLWQRAWDARSRIEAILGQSLQATLVGLAVNSRGTRTQDQLHVHVDCVRASVGRVLASEGPRGPTEWHLFSAPLRGQRYWLKAIEAEELERTNVVELVRAEIPGAYEQMEKASVAVVGAAFEGGRQGFYLLANFDDTASEALLDHACRVAAPAPQ